MIFTQVRNNRFIQRFQRNHPACTQIPTNHHMIKPSFDTAYQHNKSPPRFTANQPKSIATNHKTFVYSFERSRQKAVNQESFNLSFPSKFSQSINSTQMKASNEVKDRNIQSIEFKSSPQKTRGSSYSKKKSHYLTVVSRLPQFKSTSKVKNYL